MTVTLDLKLDMNCFGTGKIICMLCSGCKYLLMYVPSLFRQHTFYIKNILNWILKSTKTLKIVYKNAKFIKYFLTNV